MFDFSHFVRYSVPTLPLPGTKPWKTTLLLTTEQREQLDEVGTRIRRKAEYRPGASEVIRASIDAAVARLAAERFDDLVELVGAKGAREASPVIERWLRERLGTCPACGHRCYDGQDSDQMRELTELRIIE